MAVKKHVAIIITSLVGGGAERIMLTLAQELLKLGHLVTVFSLKSTCSYDLPSDLRVVYPFSKEQGKMQSWLDTKRFARVLQASINQVESETQAFDLTLVNLYEAYRLAALCELKNGYYLIHNSYKQELKREFLMGPIKYLRMRNTIKLFDSKHLLGVSKGVTDELKASTLFTAKSVTTIYNPSDVDAIQELAQESIEYPSTKKFILHVGRAAKAKRHDILFQALKHVDSQYQLVCLSANTKKLAKLARKYGVSDRVILPGFTQNPYAWMSKASAVVLSSDFEGLPTVLIEAILCGTKVVSTDCPHGPREIMQGELAQFLSPVGNPLALAENINRSLTTPMDNVTLQIIDQIRPATVAQKYLALCQ